MKRTIVSKATIVSTRKATMTNVVRKPNGRVLSALRAIEEGLADWWDRDLDKDEVDRIDPVDLPVWPELLEVTGAGKRGLAGLQALLGRDCIWCLPVGGGLSSKEGWRSSRRVEWDGEAGITVYSWDGEEVTRFTLTERAVQALRAKRERVITYQIIDWEEDQEVNWVGRTEDGDRIFWSPTLRAEVVGTAAWEYHADRVYTLLSGRSAL